MPLYGSITIVVNRLRNNLSACYYLFIIILIHFRFVVVAFQSIRLLDFNGNVSFNYFSFFYQYSQAVIQIGLFHPAVFKWSETNVPGGTSESNQSSSSEDRSMFLADTRSSKCWKVRGPIITEVIAGLCKIHETDKAVGDSALFFAQLMIL